MVPDPDLVLLEAWRNGDKKAADALILKYYDLIRRTVVTKLPADAVDDVVQQVIAALVERRDTFRADATFRNYALIVVRNSIADFYRKREREPVEHVAILASSVRDLGAGPTTILFEQEDQRLLLEALRSIPLDDQFLLELYYWEDLSAPALAQLYDLGEPAVRSRIRRAKERLTAELHQLGQGHRELADTLTDIDAWVRRLRDELVPHLDQLKQTRAKKK